VEELRDDTSVCVTTSDEESGFSMGGDLSGGSDVEGRVSPGGESHLPEFKEPDEELKDRIIKQVEFYFSDANILKDAFLLKHVRRNKQGFVSLKLITSFRKMKSLSKDYRVVAFSLRLSDQLEVNDEGTKVRRKDPLPEHDETTPSRTVVAINLPMENPTIENVAELFSSCGEVVLLRILRPGKTIPPDVRKHINKHPEIGSTVCAVVEFETHESAKKATETMCNKDDWRSKSMHVVLLANQPSSKKEKLTKKAQRSDTEKSDTNDSMDENCRRKGANQRKSNARMKKLSTEEYCGNASSGSEMEAESYRRRGSDDNRQHRFPVRSSLSPQQDPNRLSPSNTPRSSPRTSPRASPRGSPNAPRRRNIGKSPLAQDTLGVSPKVSPCGSPESRRRGDLSGYESPSQSPWVQRRKAQAGSLSSSPMASPLMGRRAPDTIVRQPLGPGETKGFYGGKGRGKPLVE
ncbi:hypothetical protein CAPTEDRAFT_73288, partial [Capitella teleta]